MYCRQCGMDSRTTDVCEWCKKPMAPPQQHPAPPGVAATAPQTAAAGARVPANLAGLPPQAVTPQMLRAEAQQAETPWGERLEKFLAMGMPLLIAAVLLVHFVEGAFLWTAFGVLFLWGLLMGATGAIEPYEEAFADVFVVLVVCYLLGPVVGLGVYLVVGLIKQEWNAAIILLLLGHLFVRFVLALAFATSADPLSMIPQFSLLPNASFVAVVCSFGGWMMSSFFRPLNR
ncbi:MAG: hypothetical protein NZT92_22445 [Abditibacteriales bacterium]|nr:hypothetical protein [Abditibacteriales bacterium]MDW8368411.1 hypothetical protein [Abditibacteriales bacterium]